VQVRHSPPGARRRTPLPRWAALGLTLCAAGVALPQEVAPGDPPAGVAGELQRSLADDTLHALTAEVLERNPAVARARRRATAAALRAPQVKALPDPEASLAVFLLPPETRVGPQRFSAAVVQRFPWFGKLDLRQQAALHAAARAEAETQAVRLGLVTETRRLFYELSFLGEHAAIVAEEREHLLRHEEVARARYSAGMGLQQEVLKIQADITRAETRLVEIEARRRSVLAAVNTLRDRPADREILGYALPRPRPHVPPLEELRERARGRRPELAAAGCEIARREVLVELAGKDFKPDFKVGVAYTAVGRRDDEAGRLAPPPGNGDDVLAFSVGARLPVWKRKLEAGLEAALAEQSAAEEHRRQILAEIEGALGDAAARLPLLYRQWTLFEDVLLAQAEEALSSSEAAYTTGKINALDLLDAEHVLFEVRTAAARTRADHAVAVAVLEGAIASPITAGTATGDVDEP